MFLPLHKCGHSVVALVRAFVRFQSFFSSWQAGRRICDLVVPRSDRQVQVSFARFPFYLGPIGHWFDRLPSHVALT